MNYHKLFNLFALLSMFIGAVQPVLAVSSEGYRTSPVLSSKTFEDQQIKHPDNQTSVAPPHAENNLLSYSNILSDTIYLPLVTKEATGGAGPAPTPPQGAEILIKPGIGGVVGPANGSTQATFSPKSVQQDTWVRYESLTAPMITTPGLAVGGPAFAITAWQAETGKPVTQFPHDITIFPSTYQNPAYALITPSLVITVSYTEADIWQLDERTLSIYTRSDPNQPWQRIPSAVYRNQKIVVGEVDHLSQFVVLGQLNTLTVLAATTQTLVLDPDDDIGHATWPDIGTVTELPYNVQLAEEVKDRFVVDGCQVNVHLTRNLSDPPLISRNIRVQQGNAWTADIFNTLAFNAFIGTPWGSSFDGGIRGWARNGQVADDALVTEYFNRIQAYTGRPHTQPIQHPYPQFYTEIDNLTSPVYAHIETLFLDHNFDWPVINTKFNLIVDAAYVALRTQLEASGMTCVGSGPNPQPPPYPPPPSAAELQRLRDLGYQNLQAYGTQYDLIYSRQQYQAHCCDPISPSTGNHVTQVGLTRIPGRGGLDMDFTLTYNSQDGRQDLFGYGWSWPYNIRSQKYSDDSVSVVLHDGRTYHYTANGSGYDAPAGVHDTLVASSVITGWQWSTIDGTVLTFAETVGGLGILTEWRDRRGNTLKFSYDLSGQNAWQSGNPVPRPPLSQIEDTAGRVFTITSHTDGFIEQIDLPDGRTFSFEYKDGDLSKIIDGNTGIREFTYDERHRMTTERDPEGILFLQNIYDDRDRVVEQIDASQTHSYLGYDPLQGTTVFTDNLGNLTTFYYDTLNRVTGEKDAVGNLTQYVYDAAYNMVKMTDGRGHVTEYQYDDRGNLTQRIDPLASCTPADYTQDVTTWVYNSENDVVETTDANGHTTTFSYDAVGNLLKIDRPGPRDTTLTYNAWGQPESMTDANTHTTFYKYDTHGNLTQKTDAETNSSTSTYDLAGRELTYTDANSHTVTFDYDGNDNITKIIDPKKKETLFVYDKNDLLKTSTDRRKVVSEFQYDENLKLTAERDFPNGEWQHYAYDKLYRRTTMTDRRGFTTRYEYDPVSRLTQLIDPLGATTAYEYDANDNLTAFVEPLGARTELVYDAMNRLQQLTDAAGHATAYCYDAEDRLIRVTGPRGEVSRYLYDEVDNLVQGIDPLGAVTTYDYDPLDNLTALIDARNERTDYSYDKIDRLTAISQPPVDVPDQPGPQRPTTRFVYDPVGNTVVITAPRGFATTFSYDENDNLTVVSDPLGAQTLYTYDEEDNPLSVTDAKGHTTHTSYNEVGLPLRVTDPLGHATHVAYDADYNPVELTDANNHPTSYEYDPLSRLIREIDALGQPTEYRRDLHGNITALTDANGHTSQYSYDVLDRLQTVTDALNQPTHYEYDPAGNLVSLSDANNHITRFGYDLRDQLTGEVNPLGKTWQYSYDAVGNLLTRIDGKGDLTRYNYDSNNRLAALEYPDFSRVTFGYDLDGNEVAMCDWLVAEGDCARTTYDALNRPLTSRDWLGRSLSRSYDAVGNLTELIYPNGQPLGYDYDPRNQLSRLEDHFGQQILYQYNPVGNLTDISRPNHTSSTYSYDAADWLLTLTHQQELTTFSAFAYAMDRVGNRTEMAEFRTFPGDGQPVPVTTIKRYTYDALDRLVAADTDRGQTLDYGFDPVGNRLALAGIPQKIDPTDKVEPVRPDKAIADGYDYNEANQLTAVSRQQSAVSLEYDDNGNRIRETETLPDNTVRQTDYTYDYENRLTTVSKTSNGSVTLTATYTYDGYGRRVRKEISQPPNPKSKIQNLKSLTYVFNGLDPIADYETTNNQTTATHYYWANGGIAQIERLPNPKTNFAGDTHWTHTDGLGSLTDLTDASGETTHLLYYDEYGQPLTQPSSLTRYSYTGQEFDPETGLYHFYARYYDPARGVWLTQDPYRGRLVEPGTLQRYGYLKQNPINYIDAYGFDGACGVVQSCASTGSTNKSNPFATLQMSASNGKTRDQISGCGYIRSCEPSQRFGCGYTMSCQPPPQLKGCGYTMSCVSTTLSKESNWRFFEGEFNVKKFNWNFKDGEIGLAPLNYSVVNYKDEKGVYKQDFKVLDFEGGIKVDKSKGNAGLTGEAKALSYESNWVLGNKDFAWNIGPNVSGPKAEVCLGICKYSLGAYAGAELGEVGAQTGFNVAGWNIGVEGEARLGIKVGGSIGKKNKLHVGPFSLGLTIDKAK